MAPELGPTDAPETAVDVSDPRLPQDSPASAATAPEDTPEPALAGIAASVRELANSAERYHARAEQREGVIDHLRAEVDRLRRGERRGLLRPLLAEMCRLRNDLLRQAAELPADFDAERAALLLRSYAETVELTLESNGVVTYAPDERRAVRPADAPAGRRRDRPTRPWPGGSPSVRRTATWTSRRTARSRPRRWRCSRPLEREKSSERAAAGDLRHRPRHHLLGGRLHRRDGPRRGHPEQRRRRHHPLGGVLRERGQRRGRQGGQGVGRRLPGPGGLADQAGDGRPGLPADVLRQGVHAAVDLRADPGRAGQGRRGGHRPQGDRRGDHRARPTSACWRRTPPGRPGRSPA